VCPRADGHGVVDLAKARDLSLIDGEEFGDTKRTELLDVHVIDRNRDTGLPAL